MSLEAHREPSSPLLQAQKLCYRYPRRGVVLDQVDFDLHIGERVALTGANGTGKTTFLHLLVGLKKAKAGQVIAFGKPCVSEADFVCVRSRIGFLFQDPDDQLFCPTVLEDVAFGPLNQGKSRGEALGIAQQTLQDLGMADFADAVTHQLSGGEKRMITLATVLAMQPDILLLDEPSNALDQQARERLLTTLKSLPQAMLIISHDHDFLAQLATRTLVLDAAQLVTRTPVLDSVEIEKKATGLSEPNNIEAVL
ncbi:energy-coupling factor ABC transporter ATP-binding protein [Oceanospirillum maris]|uniref:energy-coupling factor ABC transporter ATP-binding protein n=1 Tax=Oceanospirillum maris TaxID=64977 RepID=UPI000420433D|nr:ABC transporter ATP-binding protein [Oceanospirillum maris]